MEQLTEVSEILVSYKPLQKTATPVITSRQVYDTLRPFYNDDTIALQESFLVMYLNKANKVLGVYRMSHGGINATVVDVRIVLGTAVKMLATGIIISHNHPSGNIRPSSQDEMMTARIKEASRFLEIALLDHIIISPTEPEYFSFADEGIL